MTIDDKRDANEAELVKLWTDLGAVWVKQDRFAGFDGLLLYQGRAYVVEIKNPRRKWHYTDREMARMIDFGKVGIQYHTIETPEKALELIQFSE